jgi:hypothetical protein
LEEKGRGRTDEGRGKKIVGGLSIKRYHVLIFDYKHLAEQGIATGLHYPVLLYLQEAYRHLGYKQGVFSVAERAAQWVLSLPMCP